MTKVFEEVTKGHKSSNGTVVALTQKRNEAIAAVREASSEYNRTTTRVKSAVASALVELDYQPSKLAPVVRPLMDALKSDENNVLQVKVQNYTSTYYERDHVQNWLYLL